jgi:hypothetical protein
MWGLRSDRSPFAPIESFQTAAGRSGIQGIVERVVGFWIPNRASRVWNDSGPAAQGGSAPLRGACTAGAARSNFQPSRSIPHPAQISPHRIQHLEKKRAILSYTSKVER